MEDHHQSQTASFMYALYIEKNVYTRVLPRKIILKTKDYSLFVLEIYSMSASADRTVLALWVGHVYMSSHAVL